MNSNIRSSEQKCDQCKLMKWKREFTKRSPTVCKSCYQKNHWNHRVAYNRMYHYGLSEEQYQTMFSTQQGCCAICRKSPEPGFPLHIDHDHTSGKVRGLLCNTCNSGLGMFKDDRVLLFNAIAYLNRH